MRVRVRVRGACRGRRGGQRGGGGGGGGDSAPALPRVGVCGALLPGTERADLACARRPAQPSSAPARRRASRGVARARARVAAVPASGSRSRRRPSGRAMPSPPVAAMATTVTCTRFTDELRPTRYARGELQRAEPGPRRALSSEGGDPGDPDLRAAALALRARSPWLLPPGARSARPRAASTPEPLGPGRRTAARAPWPALSGTIAGPEAPARGSAQRGRQQVSPERPADVTHLAAEVREEPRGSGRGA